MNSIVQMFNSFLKKLPEIMYHLHGKLICRKPDIYLRTEISSYNISVVINTTNIESDGFFICIAREREVLKMSFSVRI